MNVVVPASIGKLQNLRVLRLYGALDSPDRAHLRALPATIGDLHKLEFLDLGRNGLKTLPPLVARLSNLKTLHLEYNDLRLLPDIFAGLKNLKELTLDSNRISNLPPSLAKIDGLKISMGDNSLKLADQRRLKRAFPKAVFSFESEFDDASQNETKKTGQIQN